MIFLAILQCTLGGQLWQEGDQLGTIVTVKGRNDGDWDLGIMVEVMRNGHTCIFKV